jgi:hypothetical protein
MFGSETCGDFSNYWFSHITITGAGKSGLGMVSVDGAHISNVHYDDITMSGTAAPITEKIEARRRCGANPGTGTIRDIHYSNITGTTAGAFSPTLWGQPGYEIRDVTFRNVHLTLPGGHSAMDPNVPPSDSGDYNPISLSTRPAACVADIDNFSLGVQPAGQTGTAGSSVRYTVHTAVTSGRPGDVTLSAYGLPSGATATFSPNPVQPGKDSTLTVTTAPDTRNDPYHLTIVGTDPTATQYARAGLIVTGGVDLAITGLTVADPDNAADWSVQSNLQQGVPLYGDRTYTLASAPAELIGARWIRTADDSRAATANPLVTFTLTAPATVVVGVDIRQSRPSWIDASWVDTGTQLTGWEGATTYRRYELYTKAFPAGPVALGPAAVGAGAANVYTITVI